MQGLNNIPFHPILTKQFCLDVETDLVPSNMISMKFGNWKRSET